jgi:hypothetical protein
MAGWLVWVPKVWTGRLSKQRCWSSQLDILLHPLFQQTRQTGPGVDLNTPS